MSYRPSCRAGRLELREKRGKRKTHTRTNDTLNTFYYPTQSSMPTIPTPLHKKGTKPLYSTHPAKDHSSIFSVFFVSLCRHSGGVRSVLQPCYRCLSGPSSSLSLSTSLNRSTTRNASFTHHHHHRSTFRRRRTLVRKKGQSPAWTQTGEARESGRTGAAG